MKNHPLRNPETGEIEWVARNIAALTIVLGYDRKNRLPHVLANKRGPETPDPEFRGCWCLPCGYLDYNETLKEAAARECFEETGVKLDVNKLNLLSINDNPKEDKRQNVTFRYYCTIDTPIEDIKLSDKNSEQQEVEDIMWIPLRQIPLFKWAFNHDKILKEFIKYHVYIN